MPPKTAYPKSLRSSGCITAQPETTPKTELIPDRRRSDPNAVFINTQMPGVLVDVARTRTENDRNGTQGSRWDDALLRSHDQHRYVALLRRYSETQLFPQHVEELIPASISSDHIEVIATREVGFVNHFAIQPVFQLFAKIPDAATGYRDAVYSDTP